MKDGNSGRSQPLDRPSFPIDYAFCWFCGQMSCQPTAVGFECVLCKRKWKIVK